MLKSQLTAIAQLFRFSVFVSLLIKSLREIEQQFVKTNNISTETVYLVEDILLPSARKWDSPSAFYYFILSF